ncbi:MAG: hypothetical protein LUH01_02220 [Parabacteroides gordonii]|nr:hypothetical protein [Parabacteroides gordonii]
MKIVYNKLIPFKGFSAINILGIVFARKEFKELSQKTINHETIHTAQMKEMAYIFFYIWYLVEWLVKLFRYGRKGAYRNISFEREAYTNQYDYDYLSKRECYAWWKKIS